MFNKNSFNLNLKYFLNSQNPVHLSSMYNTSVSWSGTDNYKNFIDYQPNPYTSTSISYTYNELGFRSDSFDLPADRRIIFLGCSMTEGIGLPVEDTWSYILLELIKKETKLNIPYWNLGLGGCGLDAITRMFYHYGDILKPNLVFGLWPCYRREFKVPGGWLTVLPQITPNLFETNPVLIEESTICYETEKNLAIIDLVLSKNKSTLIWDYWDLADTFIPKIENKLENFNNRVDIFTKIAPMLSRPIIHARDGKHPGKEFNKRFAVQLFEQKKYEIIRALC